MNNLRLFKSEAEIRNMRKAGQASARAFTEAMRKEFKTEKELWAFLDYRFKMLGCDGSAYVPVVAGGKVRPNVDALMRLLTVPECVKHTLCPQRQCLEVIYPHHILSASFSNPSIAKTSLSLLMRVA